MDMRIKNRKNPAAALKGQRGNVLILVLVFFMLGSITLMPLLGQMRTTLKTGTKYEAKANEIYTADAGIETGLWRIKDDFLGPTYSPYDFDTIWDYETGTVNGGVADVTVQNIWLPPSSLRPDNLGMSIEETAAMVDSGKLNITGSSGVVPGQPFHIKIDFIPALGDNLTIKSIGVWMPQGFTYTAGHSDLEALNVSNPAHPDSVSITSADGGQHVIWSYNAPYPLFSVFPDVVTENGTMTCTLAFTYARPADDPVKMPLAVAWVTTDMDPTCPNTNDVPLAWDINMRYYKVTSQNGDTNIETYQTKSQLRSLGNGIAGDYVAIGNSLMIGDVTKRDQWLASSSTNVSAVSPIPDDADVLYAYLYWSGFRHSVSLFSDSCSNFNNWERLEQNRVPESDNETSGTWNIVPSAPATFFDKIDETTYDDTDYVAGNVSGSGYKLFNFSPFTIPAGATITDVTVYFRARDYSSGTNNIRAYIKAGGTTDDGGSVNPGSSWTTYTGTWTTNPKTSAAWTIADVNGTGTNPLQEFGIYSSDLSPAVLVSMVYIQVNYSLWTVNSGEFQGQGSTNMSADARTLTLKNPLNLSTYAPGTVVLSWTQSDYESSGSLSATDTFYYALSGDNGTTWSSNIIAFQDDISEATFYALIPASYLTSQFKIRFYYNFATSVKYVRMDNIAAYYMPPDTDCSFAINGEQVYFDAGGSPQAGSGNITASFSAVLVNQAGTDAAGYSYACYKDVSALVKKYPVVPGEQHHNGNYNFTVGGVLADTGEYVSYAGWSLIIIYSNPSTAGRYIYLNDIHNIFAFDPGSTNLDFDNDGIAGGDISGFLFPEPIRDKYGNIIDPTAAKITCFVGEGDGIYTGDTLKITGQQSGTYKYLINSASPSNNVWNGAAPGCSYPGVDVDTFIILWADGIFMPKDTSVHLDMDSGTDAWNLIYIIMSVRSETVTSGTGHYTLNSN